MKKTSPTPVQTGAQQGAAANSRSGMIDRIESPMTIFYVIGRLHELGEQLRRNSQMLAQLVGDDKPAAQAETHLERLQQAILAEMAQLQAAIIELPLAECAVLEIELPPLAGDGKDLLPDEPALLLFLVQACDIQFEDNGAHSGPGQRKTVANLVRRRENIPADECPSNARTNRGAGRSRWPRHRARGGELVRAI